ERGMKQYADSLLDDGMLPYWPGGTTANGFVTCQALWSVNESVNAGFEPPGDSQEKMAVAVKKTVKGQLPASRFENCFALFAHNSQRDREAASSSHVLYNTHKHNHHNGSRVTAPAHKEQNTRAPRQVPLPTRNNQHNHLPRIYSPLLKIQAQNAHQFQAAPHA